MISRGIHVIVLLAACLFEASEAFAFDYADARSKAVTACEAINPSQSQSGLIFNPDGYRSFYVRSKCFQEAAIEFRDRMLCAQVRERRSLLSSSWGYSAGRCRQLVAQGTATDRASLEAIKTAYVAGGILLRDFRVRFRPVGELSPRHAYVEVTVVGRSAGRAAHPLSILVPLVPIVDPVRASGGPA